MPPHHHPKKCQGIIPLAFLLCLVKGENMKVKISMTVDIDPEVWTMNYGTEGAAAIREDAKEAIKHSVYAYLEEIGVLLP